MSIKGVTDLTVTSIPVKKIVDHRTMIEDSVVIVVLIIRILRKNEVRTMRKNHATRINVKRKAMRKKRMRKIIIIVMIVEGIELVTEMTEIDAETEKEKENVVILGMKDLGIDIGKKDQVIIKKKIVRDQGPGQGIVLHHPSEQ